MTSVVLSIALVLTPAPFGQRTQEAHPWPVSPLSVTSAAPEVRTSPWSIQMDWSSEPSSDAPIANDVPIVSPSPLIELAPIEQGMNPSDAQLYRLRMCESTDRYWISTGNGYYGAYQFDTPTWNGVAARHAPYLVGIKPNLASPGDQDAMVRWLWDERGPQPWPVCGYRVGAP